MGKVMVLLELDPEESVLDEGKLGREEMYGKVKDEETNLEEDPSNNNAMLSIAAMNNFIINPLFVRLMHR
jgi:hypothetical protein